MRGMTAEKQKSPAERAKVYFSQPGFERLLAEVWKKLERLEYARGNACISSASAGECVAYNEFFGEDKRPGSTLRIPLKNFEEELQNTPFPFTLKELYSVLNGEFFMTRSEKQLIQEEAWKHLFNGLMDRPRLVDVRVRSWIERLSKGSAPGYRTLNEIFHKDMDRTKEVLEQVVEALHQLWSGSYSFDIEGVSIPGVRLPVLAAKVSGDSHAFDNSQPAGRLLKYALRDLLGESVFPFDDHDEGEEDQKIAMNSLQTRDMYRSAGIADDDLSSTVYVYQPNSSANEELKILSLRQVDRMKEGDVHSQIYIVENPSVFSTLMDLTEQNKLINSISSDLLTPALLCTSGSISAAALRWLQLSLETSDESCSVYYSGDFDVKGLEIAMSLAKKIGNRFVPWHFDDETYVEYTKKCQGPIFEKSDRFKLTKMSVPWSVQLTSKMIEQGHKLYQESFIDCLARDWQGSLRTK